MSVNDFDPSGATAITLFGIQCWDEGTRENWGRQNSSATRQIVCKWSDRISLKLQMTQNSVVVGSIVTVGSGATYPDYSTLRCQRFETEGIGVLSVGANGMVAYKYARCYLTYSTIDLGEFNIDYSSEVLGVPTSDSWLHYDSSSGDPVPVEDCPNGIAIPCSRIVRTLRGMTKVPFAAIKAAETAPCNSVPVSINGVSYDKGFVLFDGAHSIQRFTSDITQNSYDLEIALRTRMMCGWNSLIDKTGAVRDVFRESGDPLFPTSDLNTLFTIV